VKGNRHLTETTRISTRCKLNLVRANWNLPVLLWTEKDLHVEQILFDEEFWDMICQKSKHIFDTAVMPELVGKFYTRLSSTIANVSSQPGVSASAESHGSDHMGQCQWPRKKPGVSVARLSLER